MLVGITGPSGSGKNTALAYFERLQFERLDVSVSTDAIVSRWKENFVVIIPGTPEFELRKRPWFVHLNLDAPEEIRRSRGGLTKEGSKELKERLFNAKHAHITLINAFETTAELYEALDSLNVCDQERVRPSWDRYFMTIADLAAQRSNCMKRRVGCVLVHDHRIVATGYNGTPRGIRNCNDGGCARCNSASKGGSLLSTCLCLHAEENALLEIGRLRVANSILYCNTCPCLTCSIKIVQTGVCEVVYSQDYSMDQESARVLESGGVKLRKYRLGL